MHETSHGPRRPGWIQVSLWAPAAQAEAAADFLVRLTGRGVETSEGPDPEQDHLVKAFLDDGPGSAEQKRDVEEMVQRLKLQAAEPGAVRLEFSPLPDQDWSENWKRHFHPQEMAPGLWVAPPWEPMEVGPDYQVVLIDPGQAFGTGHHASTMLCLKRLARMRRKDRMPSRLLDLGCGTGILALAALKLGAASALALDLDPLALEAARHNAELNRLSSRLEISSRKFEEVGETFPLILANLTALDLINLARPLAQRLEPLGELVASGMMQGQDQGVRQALEDAGLGFVERDSLGEWCSLVMAR